MKQLSIGDPQGAELDHREITAEPILTDIFRDSLNLLYEAFMRAEAKYPLLRHQQLIPRLFDVSSTVSAADIEDDWSSINEWAEFATVNSPPTEDGWQEWHGPVQGECYEWFGRFSGYRDGLDEFRFLANTFYLVLRKLDPKLPEGGGFERLLDMMHQAAASWPTTFLRSTESTWGLNREETSLTDDDTFAECDAISNKSDIGPNGIAFFVHPEVMTIEGSLFLAAAQFVKMIAHDDHTLFLSEMHFLEPDYPIVQLDGVEETVATGRLAETGDGACEVNQGDYLFAFDVKRKVWHVRFRYDTAEDAIEEAWMPDRVGMKYIAYLLERPNKHIVSTTIFPSPPKQSRQSNKSEQQCDAYSHDDGASSINRRAQSRQDKLEHQAQMRKVAQQIKEAREEARFGNLDAEQKVIELENLFAALQKQYNQNFDKFGRQRESVDSTKQKATNRVRNRIEELITQCSDDSLDQKFRLNQFSKFLKKHIDCCGSHCLYTDDSNRQWVIEFPPV